MRKHVLFIVENQPIPYDRRVWYEALVLREEGYDVSIISPKGKGFTRSSEKMRGINVYRHPMPFEATGKLGFFVEYANALFWEILLSVRIFLREPFQIIHGSNPPDHVFLVALLFRVLGVSYVFDHHDITPENYLAKFSNKTFLYKILCLMEKLTFRTAKVVISTNESYKRIALERGGKTKDQVFVVRNGPNLSEIISVPPSKDLKNGFDYLVAYVGIIGNQECVDVLLRAVRYIVFDRAIRNIKFVIIGTGPHWGEMVKLSEEMELEKYVLFTGFVPFREFYEILSTADICVNPEYKNPFTDKSTMMKIMDYMGVGKPIVQFDTIEGRVTAGDSAIYVSENDDIAYAEVIIGLLEDPDKRERMGAIGKKRIQELLNWDKQKENLKKAYEFLEGYA